MKEEINIIDLERWIATKFLPIKVKYEWKFWNGVRLYTTQEVSHIFHLIHTLPRDNSDKMVNTGGIDRIYMTDAQKQAVADSKKKLDAGEVTQAEHDQTVKDNQSDAGRDSRNSQTGREDK